MRPGAKHIMALVDLTDGLHPGRPLTVQDGWRGDARGTMRQTGPGPLSFRNHEMNRKCSREAGTNTGRQSAAGVSASDLRFGGSRFGPSKPDRRAVDPRASGYFLNGVSFETE